jgi:hypothetical protein
MMYQKLLDERLSCLPDQIKRGISPDVIAGKINESLRQQFVGSTIPQAVGSRNTDVRQPRLSSNAGVARAAEEAVRETEELFRIAVVAMGQDIAVHSQDITDRFQEQESHF